MSAYSIFHCSYILWKSQNEWNVDVAMYPCTILNPFFLTTFNAIAHQQLSGTKHSVNKTYSVYII